MARVQTIIVGGGIGAGTPFTVDTIPYISSVDPPLLASTDFISVVLPPSNRALVVGTSDPANTATEILRVLGGLISEGAGNDSFVAGRGAAAGGTDGIAIGRGAIAGTTGLRTIAIGAGNDDNTTGNDCVLIGANIVKTAGQANAVVIGSGITALGAGVCINGTVNAVGGAVHICIQGTIGAVAGGSHVCLLGNVTATPNASSVAILGTAGGTGGVVAIGNGAAATGAGSICIGAGNPSATQSESLAIGFAASCTHASSIALGRSTTFAANQLTVGTSLGRISMVNIGGNTDAAPVSCTWRLANGSGLNVAGGHFIVQPGLSTGNAVPGEFRVDMGAPIASGAVLQTAATRLAVRESAAAGDTWLMLWDVDTGALVRVSVGAADSGGAGFKVLRIPN